MNSTDGGDPLKGSPYSCLRERLPAERPGAHAGPRPAGGASAGGAGAIHNEGESVQDAALFSTQGVMINVLT